MELISLILILVLFGIVALLVLKVYQLSSQATQKDDVSKYLTLLGQIPAENLNEFLQNPVTVAKALGIIVEQHALTDYNNKLMGNCLKAARAARSEELRSGVADGVTNNSYANRQRATAECYERQAEKLELGQRRP